jgi:hypothetical protein
MGCKKWYSWVVKSVVYGWLLQASSFLADLFDFWACLKGKHTENSGVILEFEKDKIVLS